MSTAPTPIRTAQAATSEHVTTCRALLAELGDRLTQLDTAPEVNWGHAGSAAHIEELLLQALGRGE